MENNLRLARFNANVGLEYFFLPRLSLRGELNYFRLSGSDALADPGEDRISRNLSFFSNNKEANLAVTVNLLPLPERFDRRAYVNFYAFAGIAMLTMNPKAEYQGKTYANIANMVQLPKMMQGSVPAGVNEAFIYETVKHPLNFDKVWPWQQKMIADSSEYRGTAAAKQAQSNNDMPDDIPF